MWVFWIRGEERGAAGILPREERFERSFGGVIATNMTMNQSLCLRIDLEWEIWLDPPRALRRAVEIATRGGGVVAARHLDDSLRIFKVVNALDARLAIGRAADEDGCAVVLERAREDLAGAR